MVVHDNWYYRHWNVDLFDCVLVSRTTLPKFMFREIDVGPVVKHKCRSGDWYVLCRDMAITTKVDPIIFAGVCFRYCTRVNCSYWNR
jgi:glucose dehydrogenase